MVEREIFAKAEKLATVVSLSLLLLLARDVQGEDRPLPDDCYLDNDIVSLAECSQPHYEIMPWMLMDGYYGEHNLFIEQVPDKALITDQPGTHMAGNASYMAEGVMEGILVEKAALFGLDPANYIDAAALDNCGYRSWTIWIRRSGETEWVGPILSADCTNIIHLPERSCMNMIIEVGLKTYRMIQLPGVRGRVRDVEIVLHLPGDLNSPPVMVEEPVHYFAQEVLAATGQECYDLQ